VRIPVRPRESAAVAGHARPDAAQSPERLDGAQRGWMVSRVPPAGFVSSYVLETSLRAL